MGCVLSAAMKVHKDPESGAEYTPATPEVYTQSNLLTGVD